MKFRASPWLKQFIRSKVIVRTMGIGFPAVLCFLLVLTPVKATASKPQAVVSAPWGDKVPSIKEQILFQHLLQELRKTHDLQNQPRFEQALTEYRIQGEGKCGSGDRCVLQVHQSFPGTLLYLMKRVREGKRERLGLIFTTLSGYWYETYFSCNHCETQLSEYLVPMAAHFNAVVLGVKPDARPSRGVAEQTKPESTSSGTESASQGMEQSEQTMTGFPRVQDKPVIPVPLEEPSRPRLQQKAREFSETQVSVFDKPAEKFPVRDEKFTLELLRFRLAERQYNQLIWKGIKKRLMFFRQKHRGEDLRRLKAKLRLNIDPTGKVIQKKLLTPSDSVLFNQSILDSVSGLELPPPMQILVDHPPYVVTILIQP